MKSHSRAAAASRATDGGFYTVLRIAEGLLKSSVCREAARVSTLAWALGFSRIFAALRSSVLSLDSLARLIMTIRGAENKNSG